MYIITVFFSNKLYIPFSYIFHVWVDSMNKENNRRKKSLLERCHIKISSLDLRPKNSVIHTGPGTLVTTSFYA